MNKLKLLFVIVDREKTDSVIESISPFGSIYTHTAFARGTAKSDWLNILGLGESEKSLIIFSLMEKNLENVYVILKNAYKFNEPGRGIAFTMPISSVGGMGTLKIMSGEILQYLGGKNNG